MPLYAPLFLSAVVCAVLLYFSLQSFAQCATHGVKVWYSFQAPVLGCQGYDHGYAGVVNLVIRLVAGVETAGAEFAPVAPLGNTAVAAAFRVSGIWCGLLSCWDSC